MANMRYFADLPTGEVVTFNRVDYRSRKDIRGYSAEHGGWIGITRTVEMKAAPSRHECDARCLNASGRVMKCECSCGGRNHGRGAFSCN